MNRYHPFSRKEEKSPQSRDEDKFKILYVIDLPENTSEDDVWPVLKEVVPVEDVHIAVDFDTRTICDHGFILMKRKYEDFFLNGNYITLDQSQLVFRESAITIDEFHWMKNRKDEYRPPVADWCQDIRPGHPDYQLSEPICERFDLTPPEDRPSAHILVDDVILIIFKRFTVCQLLSVERTCRRWQDLVHRILGGHSFVNLANKTSIWGRFGYSDHTLKWNYRTEKFKPFFGPTFVHKILVLNAATLEHLVICNLPIDRQNIRRAIRQCCPNLNHCFDVQLEMFEESHCYTIHRVEIVHRPLLSSPDWTVSQSIVGAEGRKHNGYCWPSHSQCECSDYIDQIIHLAS